MKQIPLQGTKVCRTCQIEKHVLAFASDPSAKDHLQSECRECVGVRSKRSRSLRKGVRPKDQSLSNSAGSFTFGHVAKKIHSLRPAVDPLGLHHPPDGD